MINIADQDVDGRGCKADDDDDEHEHDLVMPGFRFHPTEEELIDFYLRRKVEGRRFNVDLITFLDLYRYDPWELPALATIGEKEWFFYVPRDRKYRNGDRPNRVTTSGYWKATGADRVIKAENHRAIGLKKTLVFYHGKAPKGTRSSWIMNEYRLPHSDTAQYQRTEISLCRVYKRAGVDDNCEVPGTQAITGNCRPPPSRATAGAADKRSLLSSSSSSSRRQPLAPAVHPSSQLVHSASPLMEKATAAAAPPLKSLLRTAATAGTNLSSPILSGNIYGSAAASIASLSSTTSMEEDSASLLHHSKNSTANYAVLNHACSILTAATATNYSMPTAPAIDELNRLVCYNQSPMNPQNQLAVQMPPQPPPLNQLTMSLPMISEKLCEWWNPLPEVGN